MRAGGVSMDDAIKITEQPQERPDTHKSGGRDRGTAVPQVLAEGRGLPTCRPLPPKLEPGSSRNRRA